MRVVNFNFLEIVRYVFGVEVIGWVGFRMRLCRLRYKCKNMVYIVTVSYLEGLLLHGLQVIHTVKRLHAQKCWVWTVTWLNNIWQLGIWISLSMSAIFIDEVVALQATTVSAAWPAEQPTGDCRDDGCSENEVCEMMLHGIDRYVCRCTTGYTRDRLTRTCQQILSSGLLKRFTF